MKEYGCHDNTQNGERRYITDSNLHDHKNGEDSCH